MIFSYNIIFSFLQKNNLEDLNFCCFFNSKQNLKKILQFLWQACHCPSNDFCQMGKGNEKLKLAIITILLQTFFWKSALKIDKRFFSPAKIELQMIL